MTDLSVPWNRQITTPKSEKCMGEKELKLEHKQKSGGFLGNFLSNT